MALKTIKDGVKQILGDLTAMVDSNNNPLFQYCAVWNDHVKNTLKGTNYSFLFPAIFVEVQDFNSEVWGVGVSVQDLYIKFHICHQQLDAIDGTLDQDLDVFDLRTSIRKYFTNYSKAPTFNTFMFQKEQEDYQHNMIYHWIETFKTRYCDLSGCPYFNGEYLIKTSGNWTVVPTILYVTNPPDQDPLDIAEGAGGGAGGEIIL
jgi:hypothetical protein